MRPFNVRRDQPSGAPDQLANLDQVPVWVAHITADFAATVDRRGQKLSSAGAPLLIDGLRYAESVSI